MIWAKITSEDTALGACPNLHPAAHHNGADVRFPLFSTTRWLPPVPIEMRGSSCRIFLDFPLRRSCGSRRLCPILRRGKFWFLACIGFAAATAGKGWAHITGLETARCAKVGREGSDRRHPALSVFCSRCSVIANVGAIITAIVDGHGAIIRAVVGNRGSIAAGKGGTHVASLKTACGTETYWDCGGWRVDPTLVYLSAS